VRSVKLAVRAALSWRRSISASVASVTLVGAILVVAASVYEPIQTGVHDAQRSIRGELAGVVSAEVARRLVDSFGHATLVSVSRHEPATIEVGADFLIVRAVHGDVFSELSFRGLLQEPDRLDPKVAERLRPGDAILLATSANPEQPAGRIGRIATGTGERLIQVLHTAPVAGDGPELLVHDPRVVSVAGELLVRVRGSREPLGWREQRLAEERLRETDWQAVASDLLAPLRQSMLVLGLTLTSLMIGTLIPGQILLVRRGRGAFLLLSTWGFPGRSIAAITVLIGAVSAAVAAAVGAAIGLGVASVMNTLERSATELIPIGMAERLAATMVAPPVVTPAVGWAAAWIATTALLGAGTALPAALIAVTIARRRGLSHWQ
jgi:hypothetical protein